MTLHRKTVLFLVCISLLMFTVFYMTSRMIVMSGFQQVELKNSEENMQFTLRALEHQARDIGVIAENYSAWDETYKFVAKVHKGDIDQNPYIQSNYSQSTYTENQWNLVMLLNSDNKMIYGGMLLPDQQHVSPVSAEILNRVTSSGLFTFHDMQSQNAGIIVMSDGPMLLVSEPITTNTFQGPGHGGFVVGRLLNKHAIDDIASRTNIQTGFWQPASTQSSPATALNVGWIKSMYWTNLNGHNADSYAEIMDVNGKPAFGMAIHLPRTIFHGGQHTLDYFVVFLVFVSLGYTVFVLWFFESSILKRIVQFMNGMETIRKGNNLSARVKVSGKDEIARLQMEFNQLMSSLETSEQVVRFQAYHDSLTGLLNRNQFYQLLRNMLEAARRDSVPFTVLFIDVDKFKSINDRFGHDVGDLLLKSIANRLAKVIGKAGSVSRIGGDEFTALLPGIGGSPDSEEFVSSVIRRLSEPYELLDYGISVSASVGYSQFPSDGVDAGMLVKAADRYMFTMKHDKKSCKGFSPMQMRDRIARTIQLEQDIELALSEGQFYTVYQPKVDTKSREVVGVETLLRWNHPILGFVSPAEFIPIAERTSNMSAIGAWVMQQACLDHAKWIQNGGKKLRVAVNISSIQFMSPALIDSISDILHESRLDPDLLELEITESLAMQNVHEVIRILSHLKKMGVRIAIDDFGTGYSSLSYLSQFPIDFLKIDKSFIDGMCLYENDMKIVKGIIELAHSLHFSVIAEGVETWAQYELLRDLNCDEIQGYLFGKPMKEAVFFEKVLRSAEPLNTSR